MKIRRYIVTIAVEDGEAERLNIRVIEDSILHGLGIEPGIAQDVGIVLADERHVSIPDPDNDTPESWEHWAARAEEEVYKHAK